MPNRPLPFKYWLRDTDAYNFAKKIWYSIPDDNENPFRIMNYELSRHCTPEQLKDTVKDEPKAIKEPANLPITAFVKKPESKPEIRQEPPSLFSDDELKYS
jgi:hypothetical protein